MARFEESSRAQLLWEAALREAAGPLSAYITPTAFALENLSVQALLESEEADFAAEIESRLDLGRAQAFLQLVGYSDVAVTTVYRHVLSYSRGAVRGKIHVPRYVLGMAHGNCSAVLDRIHLPDHRLSYFKPLAVDMDICTSGSEAWNETVPNPIALIVAIAYED
jgi:hypothetical protein